MAYSGLSQFINDLESKNEILSITAHVSPELEITEIADRMTKSGGKALLFRNNGTGFPVLINAFGSERRITMALGRESLDEIGTEIEHLFGTISDIKAGLLDKIAAIPGFVKLAGYMPLRTGGRGSCQDVIHHDPDLGILPVLKCWPYDGGHFITLPLVHTVHPETGRTNVGMYRMQILGRDSTAMHWQRHKTGSNHFHAWKKIRKRMPVSVALGGDPVYTYAATAPVPENFDEYILAGFLRKKRVRLVRCLTNELFVPYDADIVIEGYVDPEEEPAMEGPFGDHTGFYSLEDHYPRFRVTCITYSRKAVYPATIVGIPPQEDAWFAKATEKIFLSPLKLAIQPEIEDLHMPDAGVAHNLAIVRIRKSYPGQGMKVISSLSGAGQMMFTKYMAVVSGETDIRNYRELIKHILSNADFERDLLLSYGPLDVLDHSSDSFSFGGKAGIDATCKHPEEENGRNKLRKREPSALIDILESHGFSSIITNYNPELVQEGIPVLIITVDRYEDPAVIEKVISYFRDHDPEGLFRLILAADINVDPYDLPVVAWQLLANSDPGRDISFITSSSLLIDGTVKIYPGSRFPRRWPNIVCSDMNTIMQTDQRWESLGIGPLIQSPSLKYIGLCRKGRAEAERDKESSSG
jgi:4-hydroxy-3-polyprenylbenzoate decarboxylase